MAKIHNLGFPRIGKGRELKKALESYWRGETTERDLENAAKAIRLENISLQRGLDFVPVNDFSLYDHVLDCSIMVDNIPPRYRKDKGSLLDIYFRMARGKSAKEGKEASLSAQEMTKWFDTNYHYLVPEFSADTEFSPRPIKLVSELCEAEKTIDTKVKPVLVGPVTYLRLGKEKDDSNRIDLLPRILPVYGAILKILADKGVEWVQIDEPVLAADLDGEWREALYTSCCELSKYGVKILVATFFGELRDNLDTALALPVHGLHIDAVRGAAEIDAIAAAIRPEQTLSLGVVNGRNVWKSDLDPILDRVEPIAEKLGDRLWIAPSCSLLHVPVSLEQERSIDPVVRSWLAFAVEKINELGTIKKALDLGRSAVRDELEANAQAIRSRRNSDLICNRAVREALARLTPDMERRKAPYCKRSAIQRAVLDLPKYPTTTIGSIPQTVEIRSARSRYRKGDIDEAQYEEVMRRQIAHAVKIQEELGLDVLVHGEAERNDMVEYFGERLEGFAITSSGWVQSYGSRCVKPPVIFGDVFRKSAITVRWTEYAQSLTAKPMKGMITGPVTILNWSFVRDDQPRKDTCRQIALAMRDEVLELEKARTGIIQIDEAALREGLPLRKSEWKEYLDWAVGAFRITANGVSNQTQIHTHMCYSEFNDIIEAIAAMDADVITIECSRSDMELLDVFDDFKYPNEIGPGVYDIHSPNIPSVDSIVHLMRLAAEKIPCDRLWINPDCGLKTRQWDEVIPSLRNMVAAAKILRGGLQTIF